MTTISPHTRCVCAHKMVVHSIGALECTVAGCACRAFRLMKICPECGQPRPDDDRVAAGMKCGQCAYGT